MALGMDTKTGRSQPDWSVGVEATSKGRKAQKTWASVGSRPDSSHHHDRSNSPSMLHSSISSSVNKRKQLAHPANRELSDDCNHVPQKMEHHNHYDGGSKASFKRQKTGSDKSNKKIPPSSPTFAPPYKASPTQSSNAPSNDTTSSLKRRRASPAASTSTTDPPSSLSMPPNDTTTTSKRASKKPSETFNKIPTTSARTAFALPSSSSVDVAGPSSFTSNNTLNTDPNASITVADKLRVLQAQFEAQIDQIDAISLHMNDLNRSMRKACDDLAAMRAQNIALQKEMERSRADEAQARHSFLKAGMDATLDRVCLTEDYERKLKMERNRRLVADSTYRIETERLKERHLHDLKSIKAATDEQVLEATNAAAAAKADALHSAAKLENVVADNLAVLQDLNAEKEENTSLRVGWRAAEMDLSEMAALKVKERDEARSQGLPPAYGSLDDEDHSPPWGRHQDRGMVHVALIEDTAREKFNNDFQKAMVIHNSQRQSVIFHLREQAACELFRLLSAALSDISGTLNSVLTVADFNQLAGRDKSRVATITNYSTEEERGFFAARVVKLLIDFSWQLIAAFEIRPTEVSINPGSTAVIDVFWRNVDAVLTHALELAFRDRHPKLRLPVDDPQHQPAGVCPQCRKSACAGWCVRLNELQTLAEQLKVLQGKLDGLAGHYQFLALARMYVEDALEADLRAASDASDAAVEGASSAGA